MRKLFLISVFLLANLNISLIADENNNKLIDLKNSDIGNIKIKKNISGKKIKSVEVLVKIANSN